MAVLGNNNLKRKEKIEELKKINLSNSNKDLEKAFEELFKMILRMNANLATLFHRAIIDENDKPYKICLEDELEEKRDFIESQLQEHYEYFTKAEEVASYFALNNILKGEESISNSMVIRYENHKKELQQLKKLIKTYLPDYYRELFKTDRKYNYVQYIEHPKKNKKQDFYNYLISLLDMIKDESAKETIDEIKNKMELNIYLEKQTQKENGAIPFQLHLKELEKIIDNQGVYYPELAENKEKIMSLLTFRVPYYVGPLNKNSKFSWIVRKGEQSIYPWNFNEEVNIVSSAEAFIRRMTNMCTYLPNEEVVPKNSILYSKFMVLNELNKVRVDGKPIDLKFKLNILEDVFMKKNTVKDTDIINYYKLHHMGDVKSVKGMQKEHEFASSLASLRFYKSIYKERFNECIEEIEQLIEWSTVYEDQEIFKKRIEQKFPHIDKKTVNRIVKKRFTGWGSLSRKLLEELKGYDKEGNCVSIMDLLYNSNDNFMQIINNKSYGFKEAIEAENKVEIDQLTYDVVNDLQGSPKIKKGIWQAIKVVKEIVEVMGYEPTQINIEFAREEGEKVRTDSRVKKLKDLYKEMEKELDEYEKKAYDQLKKEKETSRLDSERLFLYYTQMGKCMYTGEPLDINLLSSNYEVDHILPRSHIKDDSLDNKVLVKKLENQTKAESLVLPEHVINKQEPFWEKLFNNNLISAKKYYNLKRRRITPDDELKFINRQLVETRQIIKHVANLLKNEYKNTDVVAVRARLSHDFRIKHQIYKLRELNDYHHAQDAYIANVIGTFIINKYPELKKDFIFDDYNYISKDIDKKDKWSFKDKEGFILSQMNNKQRFDKESGEIVWNGEKTISLVKDTCDYKDCFVTRKVEQKSGGFFNVTIVNAKEAASTYAKEKHKVIPINKERSNVSAYGGYMSINKAYGIAVEYTEKKKTKRTIIAMPIMYVNASKEEQRKYIEAETNDTVKIIKDKILFDTLIEVEGQKCYMASDCEWNNATQLLLSKKSKEILYCMLNYKKDSKLNVPTTEEFMYLFDEIIDKGMKYYPLFKNALETIRKNRNQFENAYVEDGDKRVGKVSFIKKILGGLKAGKESPDLMLESSKICSRFGRMSSKTIDLNKTTFISTSVTGLFEKKYKL